MLRCVSRVHRISLPHLWRARRVFPYIACVLKSERAPLAWYVKRGWDHGLRRCEHLSNACFPLFSSCFLLTFFCPFTRFYNSTPFQVLTQYCTRLLYLSGGSGSRWAWVGCIYSLFHRTSLHQYDTKLEITILSSTSNATLRFWNLFFVFVHSSQRSIRSTAAVSINPTKKCRNGFPFHLT